MEPETRGVPAAPARIGLWGTFDVESLGDVLSRRITRAELGRRLPDAAIRSFSPLGRPTAFDGEDPPEMLGDYGPERLAALADELDVVVIGAGEIVHGRDDLLAQMYAVPPEQMVGRAPSRFFVEGLGPALERRCPVVWHAVGLPFDVDPDEAERYRRALAPRRYVTVADAASKRRLERVGLDREVEVVPDPMVLLPRLFPQADLEGRLAQMRVLGWYPQDAPALVVQGGDWLLERVDELVPAIRRVAEERGAEIVLVETGPAEGNGIVARAMAERLGPRARHAEGAVAEDVLAAIAGAAGFVGTSFHGNLVAFLSGRPHAMLGWGGGTRLEELARLIELEDALVTAPEDVPAALTKVESIGARPDLVRRLQQRVDAHYDRIAEIAESSPRDRRGPSGFSVDADAAQLRRQIDALAGSHSALARRVATQRVSLAKHVEDLERRQRERVARLEEEVSRRAVEIEALRRTLADEHDRLEGEVAERERQIHALLNTRTYRYTAVLRRLWGRLRGLIR